MKKLATILTIAYVCTICFAGYKCLTALTHPIKYTSIIQEECKIYNLEPSLIASVINVESHYNKNAKSYKNALGLMQIKIETVNYLNSFYKIENYIDEKDLFNPQINIHYGCMYIKYLLNKFDNINTVLASYNAGETRVRVWLNDTQFSKDKKTLYNIPYLETKNYVLKIQKNIKFYNKYL